MKLKVVLALFFIFLTFQLSCRTTGETRALESVRQEPRKEGKLEIKCEVRVYKSDNAVWAEVVFKNIGDTSALILRRNLMPNGKLTWAAFDVERGDDEVPYHGVTIKIGEPKPDNYYLLDVGQSIRSDVNLSENYDLADQGDYTIQYIAINPHIETHELSFIKSDIVAFSIPLPY